MASHNITDDGSSQGLASSLPEHSTCLQPELPCQNRGQGHAMIDGVHDDVLLEIFDFCRLLSYPGVFGRLSPLPWTWGWKMLTQVCRRWRYIIFGSPRRLHLRVLFTATTPTRMLLDIWPPFPISIFGHSRTDETSVANLIAAVERRDRASEIYIANINGPGFQRLIDAMHESLPALIHFDLMSSDESVPVLPETFLGGSAPSLHTCILQGIPFPTFPKFILSATNIVRLELLDILNSEYLSPEVMATCLATLPNLNRLELRFRSPLSRPLQVGLPPLTRAVLPALASLCFEGANEYFEDFLARTHIPLLNSLHMHLFTDLIFDIPRTRELIDQVEGFKPPSHAWVMFDSNSVVIKLGSPPTRIQLGIQCEERDERLSLLAHVCGQHLSLSCVEQLTVCELYRLTSSDWKDDMDPLQWLEPFHPFVAVRDLYVARQFVPFVTAALQKLAGESTMDVLPALNNLFLEGFGPPGPEAIRPFVSARQLSNHPIVILSKPPPYPS